MSVETSQEILLNRPGFMDKCELWRTRMMNQTSENLGDVYEVWRKVNSEEFNTFLSTPYSYLLNMNVD